MADPTELRILITRLSALGDCVLTLPVLCALRDHFPRASISWLIQHESAALLRSHPDLSEVIPVRKGWLKSFREIRRIRSELRARNFDVVIDPQGLTKSSLAGWLSGSRRRIGLASPKGREVSVLLNNELIHPAQHVVQRYLNLLQPLGIANPESRFRLPRVADAVGEVGSFIATHQLQHGYVVLNPGAGWPSKRWPTERYAAVARHLFRQFGITSVANGFGSAERTLVEDICQSARGCVIPAPEYSLPSLVELLRLARFFVGSDTGPMHIAAAVETPCIALFGPTRREEIGPADRMHTSLQTWYQHGSTRYRRSAANYAMQAITVDEVISVCEHLVTQKGDAVTPAAATRHGVPRTQPPSSRSSRTHPAPREHGTDRRQTSPSRREVPI